MRTIKVLQVTPTSTVPGQIEIAGDFTAIFLGKYFRDPASGDVLPPYTPNPPLNYKQVVATTFDLIDNKKYMGRYTVYTSLDSNDLPSSSFNGTGTVINVNESVLPLIAGDSPTSATDGYVTNISTYLLVVSNDPADNIIVPPGTILPDYPVELLGRNVSGWGEVFDQNFVDVTRNFAGAGSPPNAFIGQIWYDTDDGQFRTWNGSNWDLVNRASYGTTWRHTQGVPATTWTVNHGLGFPAPYIGFVQFFVDRGNGPKMIIPSDVTFVSPNQLTVTFTNPEIGYVLVRQ